MKNLNENFNIVILTGAGISKESGLSTFRDSDGIWSRVKVEDVATPEGFARDPVRVQEFYNTRRRRLLSGDVQPNAAHRALARLEAEWPGQVLLVTQNIDDLHERGGSRNVVHMHGEMLKSRCTVCGDIQDCRSDVEMSLACPLCGSTGTTRPHVVWFGEMPLGLDRIYGALDGCGMFMSIGTSGNVYPAAGFIDYIRDDPGVRTVELNLEPSQGGHRFTDAHYGRATEIVPEFIETILGSK